MKDIITYINEGFKLGKNKVSKEADDFTDEIMTFLYNDPKKEQDFHDVIDKWINKHNPQHMNILATTDDLEEYGFIEENGISVDDLSEIYDEDNILTLIVDETINKFCNSQKKYGKKIWVDKYGFSSLYDIGESLIFSPRSTLGYFLFEIEK